MTIYDLIWNFGNACYSFGYSIGDALARYLWQSLKLEVLVMTIYDLIWNFGNACYGFGYSIGDALARYLW